MNVSGRLLDRYQVTKKCGTQQPCRGIFWDLSGGLLQWSCERWKSSQSIQECEGYARLHVTVRPDTTLGWKTKGYVSTRYLRRLSQVGCCRSLHDMLIVDSECRCWCLLSSGQMSAVETRQTSSAETRQMYSIETGQSPVSIVDICLVSTCTSKDRKATLCSLASFSIQDGTKREAGSWKLSVAFF